MSARKAISLYSYSNYREYLQDYFNGCCRKNPSFSHRKMARELGFSSPNYLKLVIDGKRNIGLKSLDRLIEGLTLREREKHYFRNLVFFCQAVNPVEKDYFFKILTSLQSPVIANTLTPKEYRYYSEWYNCVVRELVVREKAPVDFESVARKIRPRITPAQAGKSVRLLSELGLIQKMDDGTYTQKSRIIATDREVTSLAIRNYHAKMIDLGKGSIDSAPRDQREISSVTMCISDETIQRIKKRIQQFEDELLQMAVEDKAANRVYQANLQFFPVSQEER